jgi:outer membrane protein TolC
MGLAKETEIEAAGNLKDYETALLAESNHVRAVGLDNNSDLKQLDLNAQLLQQNLQIQKTSFMPTAGLAFNYAYTSLNDHFKIGEYRWFPYSTVSLSVSIPLFKAGNFPKIRQTRIKIRQLEETRLNTERMLRMQVSSYLNNMDASTEQLASNKESIFQAEKGCLIARKRYEVGKGTILELNDSEVALTQAQLTYNQAVYDYLTARADLEQVLGNEKNINE